MYLKTSLLVLLIVAITTSSTVDLSRTKRGGIYPYDAGFYPTFYTPLPPLTATVEIRSYGDVEGAGEIMGRIMFVQGAGGAVLMSGNVTGLSPGAHGFHIHEFGDTSMGCKSMGAHYNPGLMNHGGPADPFRHVGDLGNLNAGEDGTATIQESDHLISLSGPHSIIGRGVVIHEKKDDLGRGGDKESIRTGNSGGRVACGVIALAAPPPPYQPPMAPANNNNNNDAKSAES
ncbi:hypothetical protein O3M35_001348 [Rhynocoris fuscipes]|uniref:Superoxide dismutase [Cu-Zn] n=1 Tax=Rhynocoris fuscipes TaxID=488301 RepID=A0AAW1DQL5_9HEMI